MTLEPTPLKLEGGPTVKVDAAAPNNTVIAEIFARQGQLKGGQQKKVAIDALKLIILRRVHQDARLILAHHQLGVRPSQQRLHRPEANQGEGPSSTRRHLSAVEVRGEVARKLGTGDIG